MYRYKENSLRYRDSCLGSSPERPQDPGVSHQEDPDRSLSYSSYRPWSPSSLVLWHPPAIFFLHTLLLSVLYCFFLFVCLQITIQTYVTVGKTMDLESQVPVLFTGHVTWASRFAHLMLSFLTDETEVVSLRRVEGPLCSPVGWSVTHSVSSTSSSKRASSALWFHLVSENVGSGGDC